MDFYKTLNYSFGNEDWHVEKQALRVEDHDKILCVTASGDRALHLLLTPCDKVVSIDVNPSQTALLELKIATFDRFDYEKSLAFLGCTVTPHRLQLYNEIKPSLSPQAKKYWESEQNKIKRGVIFQGRTEKLCKLAAKLFKLTRGDLNIKLFAFDDIEKQRDFIDHTWDTRAFRKLFELAFNPQISKLFLNDPGVTAYTEWTFNPGQYLYNKMLSYLRHHLAHESALLQLVFTGQVTQDAYLPYLTYAGYEMIHNRLSRIEFHTDNIVDYLKRTSANTFNSFSMSDIASYMPQSAFEKLLQGIMETAAPNARFCLRELFSKRHIPEKYAGVFERDASLESKLESEESNFVYRFMAGKITKD